MEVAWLNLNTIPSGRNCDVNSGRVPHLTLELSPAVRRHIEHPTSQRHNQFDLFPQRIEISRLDPKAVAGDETRVEQIFIVKYERESGAHQVFHDRHGWYCADHGPKCAAVREVMGRTGQACLL